ncbi:MAG: beta-galactosidase trimerization domain-containing protein [Candidatus Latescibacterota bacterium]
MRVLFFGDRRETGFAVKEICSRLDCDVEMMLTSGRTRIGTDEPWIDFRSSSLTDSALTARFTSLLKKDWNVIWLDFEFGSLSETVRNEILGRVRNGSGLLYIGKNADLRSFLSGGKFDEKLLDTVSFGGSLKPEYGGYIGKGIVFVLPSIDAAVTGQDIGDYFSQAIHSIMLAARCKSNLRVLGREKPSRNLELESLSIMNFSIEMVNSGKTGPHDVIIRYRDTNGKTAYESHSTYAIKNGKTYLRIRYPMLPLGRYSLDISVFEGNNVAALIGTSINVGSEEMISDIAIWNQGVSEDQYISGSIKSAREIKEGINVIAELLDQWGGQIGFSKLQTVAGRKSVDFTFKVSRLSRGALTLRVTFYKNNAIYQVIEKTILAKHEYNPGEFSFIVAGDRSFHPWEISGYDRLIKEGATGFVWNVTSADPGSFYKTAETISRQGVSVIPLFDASDLLANKTAGSEKIIAGKGQKKISSAAVMDTLRNLDTPAFWFNASYSDSAGFDGVRFSTLSEAKKTGDFGKWFISEQRRMNVSLQGAGEIAQMAVGADSSVKTGISGYSPYLDAFKGIKSQTNPEGSPGFSMYPQESGICFSGDSGFFLSLSLWKQPGGLHGLITGGESFRRGNEALLRAVPWQSLFLGLNSIFWSDGFEGTKAALAPGMTVSPAFSVVAEETREIMGGIDRLLLGANRRTDGIAIVYSPNSILSAFATDVSGSHASNWEEMYKGKYERSESGKTAETGVPLQQANSVLLSAHSFLQVCMDVGYNPAVISEDQINTVWLRENGFRVLFLPYMQSISDETAARIEDFARNGGTVIADVRTGIMDENLAIRKAGKLDSLFGVARIPEWKPKEIEGAFSVNGAVEGFPSNFKIDSCWGESDLTLTGGAKVLGTISGAPALIVNAVSSGKAMLLNVGMETYERLRLKGEESAIRTLVSWCMENGGIDKPAISVNDSTGGHVSRIQSTLFKDGTAWYIGLIMDPGNPDKTASLSQTCRVGTDNLIKSAYVYDVRRGVFLGGGKSFSTNLRPGEAKLFALLPYRVQDVDIKIEKNVVNPGGSIKYRVSIPPQGADTKIGRHVFKISIFEPDGSERKFFSDILVPQEGRGSGTFEILPGDPSGKWRLKVKDVATGKSAEAIFMVMPPNK